MIACLAAMYFSDRPVLRMAVVVWAAAVAASRVILGRHYVFDVLGGLLLALGVTAVVTQGRWSADSLVVTGLVMEDVSQKLSCIAASWGIWGD